jgi:hypothetical protein
MKERRVSMSSHPIEKEKFDFPDISVFVPIQSEMVAINKCLPIPDRIPRDTENFHFIRHIANIVILTDQNYENGVMEPVSSFDPPIEIRVAYKISDLIKSNGNLESLKLAYWDGGKWEIISNQAHEYQILPDTTGMVAEVKIWHWAGDPPLAWGT